MQREEKGNGRKGELSGSIEGEEREGWKLKVAEVKFRVCHERWDGRTEIGIEDI
jgi:hypothetical protein